MDQSIEEEEDLSEAHDQLRHKNFESTKIYAESSIESRRSTLERVNQTARKAANDPNFDPYDDEKPKYPDETTTSNGSGGDLHVDAVIEDTNDARLELIQKILSREL